LARHFFLSLPSGCTSLILTFIAVPRDVPTTERTIDLPGLTSMTVFLVALLLALSQGQREGWDSGYILSLWAVAAVFFIIFLVAQLTVEHPVVHLRLYRYFGFVMASIVVFLYNAGFMGANFLVALMLQTIFEFSPIQAGYILAPGAAAMGLSGFLSGKFSDRLDPRWLLMAGLLCFVVNLVCFASLTLMATVSAVTLLVLFQRGGFGMIHSAINTAIMRTLPEADRSMGSGLHNLHRGIGMSFGVAFCSMLLEKRLAVHSVLLGQQHDRFALSVEQTLDGFRNFILQSGAVGETMQTQALAALQHLMDDHVRVAAYTDCFAILALFFLGSLIPVWFIRDQVTPQRRVPQAVLTHVSAPREVGSLAKAR
jgi:nitrate/nitrite transporter NarK